MCPIDPVNNNSPVPAGPSDAPVSVLPGPLPAPDFQGGTPPDAISRMLLSLERQNQADLKINMEEIDAARGRLQDLQRQLAEQLQKALEAAKQAKKKKGGWFSRTLGSVINDVAKIIGKAVEAHKDVFMLPLDVTASFAKNLGDREVLLQSLRGNLQELSKSSETEQAVAGFVAGTTKLVGDVMAFQVVLLAAIAEGAVKGEPLADAVTQQSQELWHSLETNILDNPGFWKVTERLVQATAALGVAASGGALAIVAVGLLLVLEADNRYGVIEDIAGKEAAPWVRLGIGVAATITAGFAVGNSETALRALQVVLGVVKGAGDTYQGYRLRQEADRQADSKDRETDVQETLYRIQAIQRLIAQFIELYEEKTEHRTQSIDQGVSLLQTQSDTEAALVLHA